MWKNYADVITAGDYAGTNTCDLMVKWVDGEVTIYPDVSQNTKLPTALDQHLPNEINLAAADSVFKYARGSATGKYGGNQWPDDLIARWSDGELTKYTDTDGDGLHAEEQLAAPNDLWQTASLMTGSDLDGDSNGTSPAARRRATTRTGLALRSSGAPVPVRWPLRPGRGRWAATGTPSAAPERRPAPAGLPVPSRGRTSGRRLGRRRRGRSSNGFAPATNDAPISTRLCSTWPAASYTSAASGTHSEMISYAPQSARPRVSLRELSTAPHRAPSRPPLSTCPPGAT
ncbi:hypothetical protein [Streptomyces sp. H021]|uniref:hypothetical protein n=1 Tax=Streptomyces sp. H021 TaxID=1519486 RepID=UPI00131BC940